VELSCVVVVEDVAKDFGISIEEIFAGLLVEEELSLGGSQQSVRIFLEGVAPGLWNGKLHHVLDEWH
jgi:hypothetical protein